MKIPGNIGEPGGIRTPNQTVMSGWTSRAPAGLQAISRRFWAPCSICVRDYQCGTYANWRERYEDLDFRY